MVKSRFPRKLTPSSSTLRSQGGWVLRGFGQMILGLIFIAVVLFFLVSTSFLSEFILKNMMKFPVVVNPIAAASHKNSQHDYASEVAKTDDPETKDSEIKIESLKPSTVQKKPHSKETQISSEHSVTPYSEADVLAIEKVIDDKPNKKIDRIALSPRLVWDSSNLPSAQAIVVLGGGLTRDQQGRITPNFYTRSRLMQAISRHHSTNLPIFLSGVESRYMQKFLQQQGESAQWLEARSMNTCENARFSALFLQRLGGAPRVELVTDKWHIPRARWLFAMNGIETVPIPAALPGDPAPWWPDVRNLTHTRRAVYELVAFTRDRWFGVVGCREVP